MEKDRIEEFLEKLSELSNNYGLYISGCGCCGSPSIVDMGNDIILCDYLEYCRTQNNYEVGDKGA